MNSECLFLESIPNSVSSPPSSAKQYRDKGASEFQSKHKKYTANAYQKNIYLLLNYNRKKLERVIFFFTISNGLQRHHSELGKRSRPSNRRVQIHCWSWSWPTNLSKMFSANSHVIWNHEMPTIFLRAGVDQRGLVRQSFVDIDNLTRDGGVDITGSLDGFNGTNLL